MDGYLIFWYMGHHDGHLPKLKVYGGSKWTYTLRLGISCVMMDIYPEFEYVQLGCMVDHDRRLPEMRVSIALRWTYTQNLGILCIMMDVYSICGYTVHQDERIPTMCVYMVDHDGRIPTIWQYGRSLWTYPIVRVYGVIILAYPKVWYMVHHDRRVPKIWVWTGT